MRKKLDPRIRCLIEKSISGNHRGLFVVVGPKAKDQVVVLHYLLCKATLNKRPSVLWCYKKELGFSTHRKKRMRHIQKRLQTYRSTASQDDDPFELFIASTEIRWCYYSESHKILGQTFGMVVLQDFEAITPNLLARTVETVHGGGMVVLVLPDIEDVLNCDLHEQFRSRGYGDEESVARFSKRFLMTMRESDATLAITDKLDVLYEGVSSKSKLQNTFSQLTKDDIRGEKNPIAKQCKTRDQLQCFKEICKFFDLSSSGNHDEDMMTKQCLTLSAARGRGKSACMGLALAHMIEMVVDNCLVTAPYAENVSEFFKFYCVGLDTLGYERVKDYDVVKRAGEGDLQVVASVVLHNNKDGKSKSVTYVNAEALLGNDMLMLNDMLIVDEAAALAIPIVNRMSVISRRLMLASTLDGYEGTGKALAMKFYADIRQRCGDSFKLKELTLTEPIRYAPGDPVEKWLYRTLCLHCHPVPLLGNLPKSPDSCELFAIDRDFLFSYNKAAEKLLRQMIAIYTSAHYRNTPNDLQMIADAPAHAMFVLLCRREEWTTNNPLILTVVQVAFEGRFDASAYPEMKGAGDLLPWTLCQQYGTDDGFSKLAGARIVRIATHPDAQRRGYGKKAVKMLQEYFSTPRESEQFTADQSALSKSLFISMSDLAAYCRQYPSVIAASQVDYIGVSYGLTTDLLRFWMRSDFVPVYLRHTTSALTGLNTCIMLRQCNPNIRNLINQQWYIDQFQNRLIGSLCTEGFRRLPSLLVVRLLNCVQNPNESMVCPDVGPLEPIQLAILDRFSRGESDFAVFRHILPMLVLNVDWFKLSAVLKSHIHQAVVLGLAAQGKTMDMLSKELDVTNGQLLSVFASVACKLSKSFTRVTKPSDISV